jgi:transposase
LNFCDELLLRKGHPDQILEIAMDMSIPYIRGAELYLPNAYITFDKFHVIKMLQKVLDMVRIRESKINQILKGTKFIFLHNPENLSGKRLEILNNLTKLNLQTARVYRFKLALQKIYRECNYEEAVIALNKLYGWSWRSRIPELIEFGRSLKKHMAGILRHFKSRLTSGPIEAVNAKIQEVNRRPRGFPNIQHFKNMIYLVAGDLKIKKLYGTGLTKT